MRRFVFLLLVAVGLAVILYPQANQWHSSWTEELAVEAYESSGQLISNTEQKQLLDQADAYNAALFVNGAGPQYEWLADQDQAYQALLKEPGTVVMARLSIPAIDVDLPIFHGTDPQTLIDGVGHLYGTSLPVGGANTHTVLTSHNGMPRAELFTHLDQLVVGDQFTISVQGRQLTYQVDKVEVVLPTDIDELVIEPNVDLVSLVTCTPRGINDHRLVVTGSRVDGLSSQAEGVGAPHLPFPWWAMWFVAGMCCAAVIAHRYLRPESRRGR